MNVARSFAIGLFYIFALSSCRTYKNLPYFVDMPDTSSINIAKVPYHDLRIQADDILYVSLQTIDPTSSSAIVDMPTGPSSPNMNTMVGTNSISGVLSTGTNVLVDKNGNIELPTLGKIKVMNMTITEARDSIVNRAKVFFKSPTLILRFANFKISILGEVNKPGSYILPNERATVFDALALAGDMTIFGKRENVLLIRDSANQNIFVRLNLNSKNIVSSDYFYLRQNDVVYVEPSSAKLANLDANKNRNFAIIASVLSVLIVLATRIN